MQPVFFKSAAELGEWYRKHHETARELLAGFYKKRLGQGVAYSEALDQALAFGWIDGVRKAIDEDRYMIRFTPRRPGSCWSAVNVRRAKELIFHGAMEPSGLRAFNARDERKTQQRSHERGHATLDPALEAALRANPEAAAFFDAQPPGYRKVVTFWVISAKKEQTRASRLAHLIERSASGARINLLSQNR
jgi:uncharacterized protein YdeI (YjbR/CyaY-like superfamily)